MRYADIRDLDISNGEGIGISIFVQGCHFHCRNCFNQETWNFDGGKEWTNETKNTFIKLAKRDYIKRISILGGEPLADENVVDILLLVNEIRRTFNNDKKIWLYTGYDYDSICAGKNDYHKYRFDTIKKCDIVIDGRFDDRLKDMNLKWRGSSNQRVINIAESIKNDKVVLYCE